MGLLGWQWRNSESLEEEIGLGDLGMTWTIWEGRWTNLEKQAFRFWGRRGGSASGSGGGGIAIRRPGRAEDSHGLSPTVAGERIRGGRRERTSRTAAGASAWHWQADCFPGLGPRSGASEKVIAAMMVYGRFR